MELGVQKIADQILTAARQNAETVLLEARKSAETMLEKQRELGRASAAERVSYTLAKAKDEADTIRGMVLSDARRKASWMALSEKERLIGNVLNEVRSQLVSLTGTKTYPRELEKILVDAGIALGGGKLEVMLNEHDSSLPLDFTAISRAVSKTANSETKFTLSRGRIEASGGVLVKTQDGSVTLDNTFDGMLKRREGDLRLKIAKILFR